MYIVHIYITNRCDLAKRIKKIHRKLKLNCKIAVSLSNFFFEQLLQWFRWVKENIGLASVCCRQFSFVFSFWLFWRHWIYSVELPKVIAILFSEYIFKNICMYVFHRYQQFSRAFATKIPIHLFVCLFVFIIFHLFDMKKKTDESFIRMWLHSAWQNALKSNRVRCNQGTECIHKDNLIWNCLITLTKRFPSL